MLEAKELTKNFGKKCAVDKISFKVEPGDILGFLGNNGAGKSTTMKMLTGFLDPSSGSARVNDFDVFSQSIEARKSLGYLPENSPLYMDMNVQEFLNFIAEIRGYRGIEKLKRIDEIVELCFLKEVFKQRIETLSKGYKQRVGLAQAIFHKPKVLIMDEPTDGLDPNQKHFVRNLIKDMGDDKTIILSTHILEEVEAVCNRVIIISKGRKLVDETPEKLKARSEKHNSLVFSLQAGDESELLNRLDNFYPAKKWEKVGLNGNLNFRLYPRSEKISHADFNELLEGSKAKAGWVKTEEGRLDEVFRSLTSGN